MISEHDPDCVGDCSGRLVGKFVNKQSILVAREGCDGPIGWSDHGRSGPGPVDRGRLANYFPNKVINPPKIKQKWENKTFIIPT
jgi:hypothetical protein